MPCFSYSFISTCKRAAYPPPGYYINGRALKLSMYGRYYDAQPCPAGRYRNLPNNVNTLNYNANDCTSCDAGRYGIANGGMTTSQCAGPCAPGYWCPSGTGDSYVSNSYYECAAGEAAGQTSAQCQGPCPPGYYCPAKTVNRYASRCPAGRYGDGGEVDSSCSGPCAPGYFCIIGSVSSQGQACGSVTHYCPEGSAASVAASTGHYTICADGGTSSCTEQTRTGQKAAEPGYYATGGKRYLCPQGTYGTASGSSSSSCGGVCQNGYHCPAGSTSPQQENCAPPGTPAEQEQNYFCNSASSSRQTASPGFFTGIFAADGTTCIEVPEDDLRTKNRECQKAIPPGFIAVNGQ